MKLRNLLPLMCLACSPAIADDLVIVLDSFAQTAYAGQQVTFSGYIVNNDSAILDLNDISVSLDGMFMVDTSPFFSGPATVPGAGGLIPPLTPDFAMFNVMVDLPYTDPFGIEFGTLSILGGVEGPSGYDLTTENVLGSTQFGVVVVPGPTPTPEPPALVLLLTGAALLCLPRMVRRARQPVHNAT